MNDHLGTRGEIRRSSGRTARIGGAVAALVVLVAIATWLTLRRPDRADSAKAGGPPAPGALAGMDGMQMSGDGSAHLTAQQVSQFGITFGTVEQRTLGSDTRATGAVMMDETRMAQVAPKFGGFIERLYVDFTGQPVRRGQALMDIYSPELLAAQQELLSARALQRAVGESAVPGAPVKSVDLVAAARRRLELWDVSAAQIDEVLRTGTPRRTITLYSPASGVVTEKNVVRGQAIVPGQALYSIADLSAVWIEAALPQGDNGAVRVGSAADVELPAMPGHSFKGRVAYVYPTVDSASRSVRARISVANGGGLLKPGMYASITLRTPSRSALTVPTSAVVRTGERTLVFVDMGGGELMPHDVTLGLTAGDYTEVLSGVTASARVVTSAQYLIDSESNLAEVMRSMVGQGGAATMADMPGMALPIGPDSGAAAKGASMKGMKMPPERR